MSETTATSLRGQVRELSPVECLALLSSRRLGRVAYVDAWPVVLPVSYVVHKDTVLFRTSPYSSLGQHMRNAQAGFEVDDIDQETGAGWSVLVRGPATYVGSEEVPEAAHRTTPWQERGRSLHVRITPRVISGRRFAPR